MKIVFLDVKTIGEDIDLSGFDRLGEVVKYDFSTSEEVPERVQDADVIILNKVQVNEQTIGKAENLKLVCVTATGSNNLDKEYLEKKRSCMEKCSWLFDRNGGTAHFCNASLSAGKDTLLR